jgi:hypothetical protein
LHILLVRARPEDVLPITAVWQTCRDLRADSGRPSCHDTTSEVAQAAQVAQASEQGTSAASLLRDLSCFERSESAAAAHATPRHAGLRGQGRPRFDKVSAADLRKRLEPFVRKTQAFKKRVARKGIWVGPKLPEIEYRAKSAERKVWHPFFRGLREDL